MSMQRRVLLVLGGVLLVCLMVIAAFSLGVYVGDTRRAPTAGDLLGRPFDRLNPPAAANMPLAVLSKLPRTPDFAGQVLSTRGNVVTVRTAQGDRTVALDEFSQVVRPDGTPGTPADIGAGRVIAVVGNPGPGGRAIIAEAIGILPSAPSQGAQPAGGQ